VAWGRAAATTTYYTKAVLVAVTGKALDFRRWSRWVEL